MKTCRAWYSSNRATAGKRPFVFFSLLRWLLVIAVFLSFPAEADEHTVLLMHFEGDLEDVSGVTAGGTGQGNLSFVPGVEGQAVHIDNNASTDKSRIVVPDCDALDMTGSFTIDLWFRISSHNSAWNNAGRLVVKPRGQGAWWVTNYFLHIWHGGKLYGGYFYNNGSTVSEVVLGDETGEPILEIGEWYRSALAYNDTTGTLLMLVHGEGAQPELVFYQEVDAAGTPESNEYDLMIGSCGDGGHDAWFDGDIDELKIESVARSLEELLPDIAPPAPTGVAALPQDSTHCLVTWQPVVWEDLAGYQVYRSTEAGFAIGEENLVGFTTSDSLLDGGLSAGSIYYYKVTALDIQSLESFPSAEAIALMLAPPEPVVTPGSITAMLAMPLPAPSGPIIGFDVFRCLEGEEFPEEPTGHADLDAIWNDDGLLSGATYQYRVTYRAPELSRSLPGAEVLMTTEADGLQFTPVMSVEILVPIFMNTSVGQLDADDLDAIRRQIDLSRAFYLRNSGFKLNLDVSYLPIYEFYDTAALDLGSVAVVETILRKYGVADGQYDGVFDLGRGVPGTWSWGVSIWPFLGPAHSTGFSTSFYPIYPFAFPGPYDDVNYGLTWIFTHEFQHQLDAMYDLSGQPEMWHGDQPLDYALLCGEHFSYQAEIFRSFSAWMELSDPFGTLLECVDEDGDGLADDDTRLSSDETRIGSSRFFQDTDGDGWSDLQEAWTGIYGGTDPTSSDTDGDGWHDDVDAFPLYAMRSPIPSRSVVIDGSLASGEWDLSTANFDYATNANVSGALYLNWADSVLSVGVNTNSNREINLFLDVAADGWWHGRDNYHIRYDPTHGSFGARVMDATPEARAYDLAHGGWGGEMWDDDPRYPDFFGSRLVQDGDFQRAALFHGQGWHVEVAIPANENTGLEPATGDTLGFRIHMGDWENWQSFFEVFEFTRLPLGRLSIYGTVADALTCLPLSQGFLTAAGAGDATVRCDAVGAYTFTDLASGEYWVEAEAPGYASRGPVSVSVDTEAPPHLDFWLLPPGVHTPSLHVAGHSLSEGGAIAGYPMGLFVTIRNTGDLPASGATGRLASLDTLATVVSDSTYIGDLEPLQIVQAETCFVVNLSRDCPHGFVLPLELLLSDEAGNSWRDTLHIPIQATAHLLVEEGDVAFDPVPVGETGHRLWQVRNIGGAALRIGRLFFSGGDLALGAAVIDSTREQSGGDWSQPHPACDGDLSTRWFSTPSAAQGNYLKVDLGQELTVSRLVVVPHAGADHTYITGYELAISGDNVQYVPVVQEHNGSGEHIDELFDPVTCRYLKFTITAAADGRFVSIGELGFYRDASQTGHFGADFISGYEIPAGDSLWVDLTLTPEEVEAYEDSIILQTNDPFAPVVFVPVSGEGVLSSEDHEPIPEVFSLGPVRPNPASDHVALFLGLPQDGEVSWALFDLAGRRVGERETRPLSAGHHRINWALPQSPSNGVFILRLTAGDHTFTRRLVRLD